MFKKSDVRNLVLIFNGLTTLKKELAVIVDGEDSFAYIVPVSPAELLPLSQREIDLPKEGSWYPLSQLLFVSDMFKALVIEGKEKR